MSTLVNRWLPGALAAGCLLSCRAPSNSALMQDAVQPKVGVVYDNTCMRTDFDFTDNTPAKRPLEKKIYWMAALSKLVYGNMVQLGHWLRSQYGFNKTYVVDTGDLWGTFKAGSGTQAIITGRINGRADDLIVVAYRGTNTELGTGDVSGDLNLWPFKNLVLEDGTSLGGVHAGFLSRHTNSWPQIKQYILDLYRTSGQRPAVYFTGHSLGAALATLGALHLASVQSEIRVAGLYTFGSPRVGQKHFSENFDKAAKGRRTQVSRFVNGYDIVTAIPGGHLGYHHVAADVFWFNKENQLVAGDAAAKWVDGHAYSSLGNMKERIADHDPGKYLQNVERQVFGAVSICY